MGPSQGPVGITWQTERRSSIVTHEHPPFRIGHGYDLHRLATPEEGGKPFVLGGMALEHDRGPVGHSDGDALLHAVTDAILGALALPDIGQLFPDTAPENKDRDSVDFLSEAVSQMAGTGYAVSNLDCTIILERPKIGPHKAEMVDRLSQILGIDRSLVNIKGKTHERVDAVGEGRAIEVHVVALLMRKANP